MPGAEGLLAGRVERETAGVEVDEAAEHELGRLIEAVQAVRAWRDSTGVRAGAIVPTRLAARDYEQTAEHLARLARLSYSADGGEPVTTVPVPGGAVEILQSDEVDLGAAERKRQAKCAELGAEIERSERKLANQGFVTKARPEVVQAERDKLERLVAERDALCEAGAAEQ